MKDAQAAFLEEDLALDQGHGWADDASLGDEREPSSSGAVHVLPLAPLGREQEVLTGGHRLRDGGRDHPLKPAKGAGIVPGGRGR